jgi:hypothetical protein
MPDMLWPPNHHLTEVGIGGVTDATGATVAITITGVTQNQPTDGIGDGNTCPDASGVGSDTAMLRAERSKQGGGGRVYHVAFRAENDRGASCEGVVAVCVPLDQGQLPCVDRGTSFDSTGPACRAGCGDICIISGNLSAASCPGEPMPRPVKQRLAAARRALRQALGGTRSTAHAIRLAERAISLLDAAERSTLAGEKAGTISSTCASRLSDAIEDAGVRTLHWLDAIKAPK